MLVFLLFLLFFSFGLTYCIRRWALKLHLLDHPNHRSAHTIPTPRGGGLAIVIGFFVGLGYLFYLEQLSSVAAWGLALAAGLVALSGLLDDKFSLSPLVRLGFQLVSAVIGLYTLGLLPLGSLLGIANEWVWMTWSLSILYLLWLTNLYNFMDGINGIAGLQSLSVTIAMTILVYLTQDNVDYLWLLLASSTLGFLFWNFPNARIFMGDVGSAFLGLVLGLLSIHLAQEQPLFIWCFVILMGIFIVDASYTLFSRLVQGKKIYQAHSSHAYQQAARLYQSHTKVSLAVLVINLCWLLPLAILVVQSWLAPWLGLVMAYLPLLLLVVSMRAGKDAQPSNSGN